MTCAEWETLWSTYIEKLVRLRELKAAGRYGYQLKMPRRAVRLAWAAIEHADPDFAARLWAAVAVRP